MAISDALRAQVRETAKNRCGYCLVEAQYIYTEIEIDHIVPTALGGGDEEENLWLACPRCNRYKSDQLQAIDPETGETTPLFNPRLQRWQEHFTWDSDDAADIKGLTVCGRATVNALKFNTEQNLAFRRLLLSVDWYPPSDMA